MHKTGRYRPRAPLTQMPLAVKGLILIFSLCLFVRVLSTLGADTASKNYMAGLLSDGGVLSAILDFELGSPGKADQGVSLRSVILDPFISADNGAAPQEAAEASQEGTAEPSPSESASPETAFINASDAWLYYYHPENTGEAAPTPNVITKPAQATSPDTIQVFNKTDYTVDTQALLQEPLKIALTDGKPAVLIIHTHGSEAYLPDGKDQYYPSDPYRTQDKTQSVIRVGDELAAAFEAKGIAVLHDTGVYDYPSYQDSYNNSGAAIKNYLKKYPSIKIVIDLHRDAIEDSNGNVYKTCAQVGDTTCSQVMFVMGSNDPKRPHPNWHENLKLALHIEQKMNQLYPTLAKPIEISTLRYNQQLTLGSMIVEVGSIGNTLQESLAAVRYFGDAASEVLLKLYK